MSEQPRPNVPFKTLGTHLKYLREQSHQTLSEVSGAVEIDERMLDKIESGFERPAEDILLLLISHFDMQDQEALQLWELAGYDGDMPDKNSSPEDLHATAKPVVMVVAVEARTLYSDEMTAEVNQAGVTLTFSQSGGGAKQPMPVARVGMSHDQAQRVIQTMQQVLLQARYQSGPKALPPSIDNRDRI